MQSARTAFPARSNRLKAIRANLAMLIYYIVALAITSLTAFALVALALYASGTHPSLGSIVDRVRTWYITPPIGVEHHDILIGIASIAVVVWTGGLVAFQVRGISTELEGALVFLQFAFLTPLTLMLLDPLAVRSASLIICLGFLYNTWRFWLMSWFFRILLTRSKGEPNDPVILRLLHPLLNRVFELNGIYAAICAGAASIIFVVPTNQAIAIASLLTTSIGLLTVVDQLKKKTPATTSSPAKPSEHK